MHTHAGLAQLASAARQGEERGEERGEAMAPTAAARDFLPAPVPREEPAGKDRTKVPAATGQRTRLLSLTLPASRGEATHVPDAVPAMSLTPFVRWAYSAGGFLRNPD